MLAGDVLTGGAVAGDDEGSSGCAVAGSSVVTGGRGADVSTLGGATPGGGDGDCEKHPNLRKK